MPTPRTTRLTFLADGVDVSMPRGWDELSQRELEYVLTALSLFAPGQAAAYAFLRLAGLRVEGRPESGSKRIYLTVRRGWRRKRFAVGRWQLAWAARQMDWVAEPPSSPVRLAVIDGMHAIDAAWHGLPFGDYLKLENLWQGFISSRDDEPLRRMATLLYRHRDGRPAERIRLRPHEALGVSYWVSGTREMLARTFRNLFRRTDGTVAGVPDMRAAMDTQIRALTDGDATKEADVLRLDCWRALTELDTKAREAQEYKDRLKRIRHGTR